VKVKILDATGEEIQIPRAIQAAVVAVVAPVELVALVEQVAKEVPEAAEVVLYRDKSKVSFKLKNKTKS
jgi:hypothetical protein